MLVQLGISCLLPFLGTYLINWQDTSLNKKYISFCFVNFFFLLLLNKPLTTLPSLYLFVCPALLTIQTDATYLLISRFCTIFLIPIVWTLAWHNYLGVSIFESMLAAIFNFLFLYCIKILFIHFAQKDGLGQGDIDLYAFMGSTLGFIGSYFGLMIGASIGIIYSICFFLITQQSPKKMPFGAFMATGSILFVAFPHFFLSLISI